MNIYPMETKMWLLDGKPHRTDGPAIRYPDGTTAWYLNGKLHRADGPAFEYSNGTKKWYLDGYLHRTDGPAIEYINGGKHWYFNGEHHRVNGPAIEWADGMKSWYLNGGRMNQTIYYAIFSVRKFRSKVSIFNYAFGSNLAQMLKSARDKAVVEWYYSPDNGGGKLAKNKLEAMIGHICLD